MQKKLKINNTFVLLRNKPRYDNFFIFVIAKRESKRVIRLLEGYAIDC